MVRLTATNPAGTLVFGPQVVTAVASFPAASVQVRAPDLMAGGTLPSCSFPHPKITCPFSLFPLTRKMDHAAVATEVTTLETTSMSLVSATVRLHIIIINHCIISHLSSYARAYIQVFLHNQLRTISCSSCSFLPFPQRSLTIRDDR